MKEGILAYPAVAEALVANRRRTTDEENYRPFNFHNEDDGSFPPPRPWGVFSSGIEHYEGTFHQLLPNQSLGQLLTERRRPGASVLDLMADETVVHEVVDDFNYAHGLAVTLGFPRSGIPLRRNVEGNVGVVNGDLLAKETWVKIRGWMKESGIESFDVILSRPIAGLDHLTRDPRVHCQLLRNAWSLLDSKGGEFLFQIPTSSKSYFREYVDVLRSNHIDVSFKYLIRDRMAAKLVRTPASPKVLPKL